MSDADDEFREDRKLVRDLYPGGYVVVGKEYRTQEHNSAAQIYTLLSEVQRGE